MSATVAVEVVRPPHAHGLLLPSYEGAAGIDLLAAVSEPLVIPPAPV